ncbi:hypothetical protein T03_16323 [Trichinella britovi]|uniref:Uncharacterized protein n=1 Tax=Trichinella britovi TaxID=45882 RepID=A0A0V1AJU8_TRIBR|nr:hypothetical protein T03_1154 [Trichinella britovi]KRY25198.1 hypothetical protein T03_16323 [Trichinella britovi]
MLYAQQHFTSCFISVLPLTPSRKPYPSQFQQANFR